MKTIQYILILFVATCCSANKSLTETKALERMRSLDPDSQRNINMLISMIEDQSTVKGADAKRWIPYEFRIPLDSLKKKEVHRIDPMVQFTERTESYQCIGDRATKEKVYKIVALPYTYKIKFCPFE